MEKIPIIREKKHRLERKEYIGIKRITFTMDVEGRKELFCDSNVIDIFVNILKDVTNRNNVRNWVYVFMSDHVHFILEGLSPDADLWKTAKEFKQKTGVWLGKNSKMKWQKDFYDHIHRENEDLFYAVRYIANNPIRKGLAKDCLDYYGLGSLDFDIKELINNMELRDNK
jgi:REP element-mobilizing transposase RayT